MVLELQLRVALLPVSVPLLLSNIRVYNSKVVVVRIILGCVGSNCRIASEATFLCNDMSCLWYVWFAFWLHWCNWEQSRKFVSTLRSIWLATDHKNGARVAAKSCLAASISPKYSCRMFEFIIRRLISMLFAPIGVHFASLAYLFTRCKLHSDVLWQVPAVVSLSFWHVSLN